MSVLFERSTVIARIFTLGFLVVFLISTTWQHGLGQALAINLAYVQVSPLLSGEALSGADNRFPGVSSAVIIPENSSYLWLQALLKMKIEDYRGAEETLDRLLTQTISRTRLVLYLRGQSRLAQGDERGAVADWLQAGVDWPITRLAGQKAEEGRWEEAVALLEVAIQAAPEKSYPHRELGWVLYKGRIDSDRAVLELAQAIGLAPQDTYAYRLITRVLLEVGRCQEAKIWSEQLLRRLPKNVEALIVRGNVAYWCGDLNAAEQFFNDALKLAPENSGAHFNLGSTYNLLGQYEKALAAYRRAIAINPEVWWYWSHLIAYELEQGCTQCAVHDLEQAVVLFPSNLEFKQQLDRLKANK